jgi:hypothetical protein
VNFFKKLFNKQKQSLEPRTNNTMRFAIIGWNDGNLGDAIQTIAAKELLERHGHEVVIVKEDLPELDVDAYFVNGFYGVSIEPPRPTIYASCYFDKIEHVPKNRMIGCRDYSTMKKVLAAGSVPFFTGCLTLSLLREISNNGRKISVDIDGEDSRSHLGFEDWETAFRQAEINLKDYASCDTILTNKIHAALPGVAFGKDVIFTRDGIHRQDRLDGIGHLFTDRREVEGLKAWWEDFASRLQVK